MCIFQDFDFQVGDTLDGLNESPEDTSMRDREREKLVLDQVMAKKRFACFGDLLNGLGDGIFTENDTDRINTTMRVCFDNLHTFWFDDNYKRRHLKELNDNLAQLKARENEMKAMLGGLNRPQRGAWDDSLQNAIEALKENLQRYRQIVEKWFKKHKLTAISAFLNGKTLSLSQLCNEKLVS